MSAPPLVSVVIPSYNAGATINRAIESAKRQDYPHVEIIVVDDASTDGSAERLAETAGPDVHLIRLPRNSGASAARNKGIEAASGEFVAFLDADDEWLPHKLSRQLPLIVDRPGVAFVACRASFSKLDGAHDESLYGDLEYATGPEAWRVLLAHNFVATPTVLARRSLLNEIGGFDPTLVIGEDQDLWIKLALRGAIEYVDETLVVVHEQVNSLSRRNPLKPVDFSKSVIGRHFDAQRHRLSTSEIHRILGSRYSKLGRNVYQDFPLQGIGYLVSAALHGHQPMQNLSYIFVASGPARWLKVHLLGRKIPGA